jgi:hypothetical protein
MRKVIVNLSFVFIFLNIFTFMKYIKSIEEFKSMNEQLFGDIAKRVGLFKDKDKTSSSSSGEPSGKMKEGNKVGDLGKFTPAKEKTAPLVIVFGGIDVNGKKSGEYMYDYFDKTGDNYNLFVASDHKVDGKKAYEQIKNSINRESIKPSKKILYLFSGGWRPGKDLLESVGAKEFDKIYLVDIWMGDSKVGKFYTELANNNKGKVEYFYTSFGANNEKARKDISQSVSKGEQNRENNHMKTNEDAVKSLLSYT